MAECPYILIIDEAQAHCYFLAYGPVGSGISEPYSHLHIVVSNLFHLKHQFGYLNLNLDQYLTLRNIQSTITKRKTINQYQLYRA